MADRPANGGPRLTPRRQAEAESLLREALRAGSSAPGPALNLQSSAMPVDHTLEITGLMGPPAWMHRLKRIEDGRAALMARIDAAWGEYACRYQGRPDEFTARWQGYIESLDVSALNTLIEKHNEYYVIEARIPVAYPSGEYVIPMGVEFPQRAVTPAALLDLYPADVDMALYFSGR